MPRTPSIEIEGMDWSTEFVPFFKETWKPGEHVSIIAPTGAGKTTIANGLLGMRKYVLALDAKGGDSTLESLSYPRLSSWPGLKDMGRTVARNDEEGLVSRYIIGNKARTEKEMASLVRTIGDAVRSAYEMGGWTVYADELMILTDPRQFNLRTEIDRMLIAARDRGISFVSSYQAPTWVTPMAGKQATYVFVSYTRDTDVVNRLAEILGRPKQEIRGAVRGLEKYSWIMVGRDPREPLRVTIPDYVAPKK